MYHYLLIEISIIGELHYNALLNMVYQSELD